MFSALQKFGRSGAPAGRSLEAKIRALLPDVFYDPSDLSTLFTDSAGTTPVTAVEQPVGLMLDKSQGLVLGPELFSGGDGTDVSGWTGPTGNGSFVSSGGQFVLTAANPISTFTDRVAYKQFAGLTSGKTYVVTATLRNISASSLGCVLDISGTGTGGSIATVSTKSTSNTPVRLQFTATASSLFFRLAVSAGFGAQVACDDISVRELPGQHAYQSTSTSRPTLSARVNILTGTTTLSTQSVTTLADDYQLKFSGTGSITLSGTATGTYTAGTHTITCTAGSLTLTVSGTVSEADLRPGDLAAVSSYQRVTTSTDYDAAAGVYYLKTDGVDDGMVTNAINFSATDKMFVGAGVRKLSDAADGTLIELSASVASNNGTFNFRVPDTIVGEFAFNSKGTIRAGAVSATYAAPVTSVLSGIGNISGDSAILRVNGAQVGSSTADQGTGNYGASYPLYLFRRGGSSLPFNGWFYGAVIKGATLTDAQIALVERYEASKTKTVTV